MNCNVTNARSGQIPGARANRVRRPESFSTPKREFICAVLLLFGASRQIHGQWQLHDHRVADERGATIGAHELGWRRLNFKGPSGTDAAAFVGPEGVVFWRSSRYGTPVRIFGISELVKTICLCRSTGSAVA